MPPRRGAVVSSLGCRVILERTGGTPLLLESPPPTSWGVLNAFPQVRNRQTHVPRRPGCARAGRLSPSRGGETHLSEPPELPETDTDSVEREQARPSASDFNTAMCHFYRGEVYRSTVWRQRLDATTNWAVVATAASLSFAFGESRHSHVIFILTSLLVTILLAIESRRYRVSDVWRQRVRLLEENFMLAHLRDPEFPGRPDWRSLLAEDLAHPRYKMSPTVAVARRLRRNYCWVFLVIYAAWVIKLAVHPSPARSWTELLGHAALGPVPGWLVFGLGVAYCAFLLCLMLWAGRGPLTYEGIREPPRGAWRRRDYDPGHLIERPDNPSGP